VPVKKTRKLWKKHDKKKQLMEDAGKNEAHVKKRGKRNSANGVK